MNPVGIGVIGLGYIGNTHLRHSLKLDNVHTVAVADVSKRALGRAKTLGVRRVYRDYKELLNDPKVDAVVIALPTHLHLECATLAAEAKKDIFLEKPIARKPEEARAIISAARKNSVKLMMGYPLRFNEPFRKLREEIRNGIVGDVESAFATNIGCGPFFHRTEGYNPTPVPQWWWNTELTGGGALVDLGSHMINLLRWYFGEISDIRSSLGYRFNMNFEDSAVCLSKFKCGTVAVLNVGWFSQDYQVKVDVFGSVKCASAQNLVSNRFVTAVQVLTTGSSGFFAPYVAELQYFVHCIVNDLAPSPSGEDGLKDLEAIFLGYKNRLEWPQ